MLAARKLENDSYLLPAPLSEEPKEQVILPSAKPRIKPRFFKLMLVTIIGCIFAGGLYLSSLAAGITTKGYEINSLKREINALETTNERLRLEIAQMASLERVEELAITELGMETPNVDDYIFLPALAAKETTEEQENLVNVAAIEANDKKEALFYEKAVALLSAVQKKDTDS